jgi:phosphate transport system substrate-binding protein
LKQRLLPLALVVPLLAAACGSSSKTSAPATSAPTTAKTTSSGSTGPAGSMNLGNPPSPVTLTEAGSTLLYPFLQELVSPLQATYPNVTLSPGPGGSGKGISDAIAGTTTMGGSDAYLSPGQLSANPGLMNVPIAISSQAVNFNLSGIPTLKLTGNVIARIYQGKITKWNDQAIAALNPGVNLPSETIVPVHRIDASGDTFIFTSFLSDTNPAWQSSPGFGTSVDWPTVTGELTANGNPGMVQTCKATPGCIAYVGISAENEAQAAGLGEGQLQNRAGNYVVASDTTVESAVSAGAGDIPSDLAAPLIYEPGAQSYPIVNFEYIIVKTTQASPDIAQGVRDFLAFAIDTNGGSSPAYLAKEHFVALPSNVVPMVQSAIARISG